MALKGTLDHPKLIALAGTLDIDPCFALGILEALWHFTDKYAPEGDVGRFANRAIVSGIRSSMAPDKLIGALVADGWLDEDDEHRLVVHDWHEHSSKSTKAKVQKRGKPFVSGSDSRRNTTNGPKKLQKAANEAAFAASQKQKEAANENELAATEAAIAGNDLQVEKAANKLQKSRKSGSKAAKSSRARSGNQEPGTRNQRPVNTEREEFTIPPEIDDPPGGFDLERTPPPDGTDPEGELSPSERDRRIAELTAKFTPKDGLQPVGQVGEGAAHG